MSSSTKAAGCCGCCSSRRSAAWSTRSWPRATSAKLEPLGLDLIPFAMVRAVGTSGVGMDLEDDGDEAVIDVGAHVTNIVVHARGTTRFVRILPSGGRDITLAIARGLGVEDDVAERLKRGEAVEQASGCRGSTHRDPASGAGARTRDATRHELRGRDPLLARVLHGAGAGGPDRARRRHGRRVEARRIPRSAAPAHPGPGRSRPGLRARAVTTCRCRRRRSPRPSRCWRSPSASRSRGGSRESGQPPSPGYPRSAEVAPADVAGRRRSAPSSWCW